MTFRVIATGSSGNAVTVGGRILLDCGVSFRKIEPYADSLSLAFIGHYHSDHLKKSTVRALSERRPSLRFCGGPWMAEKFLECGVSKRNVDILEAGRSYDYGAFQVEPFTLFHDVPNAGLKIRMNGEKILYAVDTGSMDGVEARDFDLYLIEANHREAEIAARIAAKQAAGQYAYEIEARRNHLSREQAEAWLARNAGPHSRYCFLHQHSPHNE